MEKTARVSALTVNGDDGDAENLGLPNEIEKTIEETKGICLEGFVVYVDSKTFRRTRKCHQCKGMIKF